MRPFPKEVNRPVDPKPVASPSRRRGVPRLVGPRARVVVMDSTTRVTLGRASDDTDDEESEETTEEKTRRLVKVPDNTQIVSYRIEKASTVGVVLQGPKQGQSTTKDVEVVNEAWVFAGGLTRNE